MKKYIAEYLKLKRQRQGVNHIELARRMGYKNISEITRALELFENEGKISQRLFKNLVNSLGEPSAEIDSIIMKELKNKNADVEEKYNLYYNLIDRDPIDITFGYSLIPYFDSGKSNNIYNKIDNICKRFAINWGVVLSGFRFRDFLELDPYEYVIKIHSVILGRFKFVKNRLFCLPTSSENYEKLKAAIKCEEFIEPVFYLKCLWIRREDGRKAKKLGCRIITIPTVIATHLNRIIESNLSLIISYDRVSRLIDNIRNDNPVLIDEIEKNNIGISHITFIIRCLLYNGIPINNLAQILEIINEAWLIDKDLQAVTDNVILCLSKRREPENDDQQNSENNSETGGQILH